MDSHSKEDTNYIISQQELAQLESDIISILSPDEQLSRSHQIRGIFNNFRINKQNKRLEFITIVEDKYDNFRWYNVNIKSAIGDVVDCCADIVGDDDNM